MRSQNRALWTRLRGVWGLMQAEHYNIVSETDLQDGAKRLDEAAARWPLQFSLQFTLDWRDRIH